MSGGVEAPLDSRGWPCGGAADLAGSLLRAGGESAAGWGVERVDAGVSAADEASR